MAKCFPTESSRMHRLEALIIGASWAGIWSLYLLKVQGFNVVLVDTNADLGGSWFSNRYPGCRVDTEIPFYEYSAPYLWKHWSWTERFPSRAEIQRYLMWVTKTLQLRDRMCFNTHVCSAHWDEANRVWQVATNNGLFFVTRYLIPCTGYSTVRWIPDIKGLDSFQYKFHSSDWPADCKYKDKRVGIVGTAASGVQIIEAIGGDAKHLTVFQRTPNLALPRRNVAYTLASITRLKRKYTQKFKSRTCDSFKQRRYTSDDAPAERQAFYECLWKKGGLAFWLENYDDLMTSEVANDEAYAFWRSKVLPRIRDEATAEKLAPARRPHAFGAKRPALEDSYFEVFNKPNVTLVVDKIIEATPQGLRTESGALHKLDMIVFATGSDFLVGSMLQIDVVGVDGVSLKSKWDVLAGGTGVWTQLGLATAGFPNMFFSMGPQAPSAFGFTPHMAEVQGAWIRDCLVFMRSTGATRIEASASEERRWKRKVEMLAQQTLHWSTNSWYMGMNINGRQRQALTDFESVASYSRAINKERRRSYSGFHVS